MTDEEKQKLNIKIINWLGVKKIYYSEWDTEKKYPQYIPSGKPWRTHQIDSKPVPYFTDSMDACIKWIVPKLFSWGIDHMVLNGFISAHVHKLEGSNSETIFAEAETPSLAFCLSLEKLIDSEKT